MSKKRLWWVRAMRFFMPTAAHLQDLMDAAAAAEKAEAQRIRDVAGHNAQLFICAKRIA